MGLSKEIIVYTNTPFNKFRWISYMSIAQVGFISLNILLMPKARVKGQGKTYEDRQDEILSQNEFVPEDESTAQPQSVLPLSTWQKFVKLDKSDIFSIKNVIDNFKDSPYLCTTLVAASSLITTALFMYARRSAHIITLLPNDRVRFTSFSPLGMGKPPSVELPLRDVSCVQPRESKDNFSILKFKGYVGYHLVNKADGEFIEPQIYDQYLGFSRSWANR